jgi:hypothetical protein
MRAVPPYSLRRKNHERKAVDIPLALEISSDEECLLFESDSGGV